jgi:hypothetical protein
MKTTTRVTYAAVLSGLTLALATGCGSGSGIFGEIHTVSVEVNGAGQASEVKYKLTTTEDTERNVALPWKKDTRSEFAPVSVAASGANGAPVTCRIVVDGKEVARATSTGTAPATCSKEKLDK